MPKRQAKRRRERATILGIIWLLIILIGGTFAFVLLNQDALTPDWHEVINGGGRIHDVFQIRDNNINFDSRNKDVFAENFGEVPLGVRVQFHEFLAINGEEFLDMQLNDFATWSLFRADANLNRIGNSAQIGNSGVAWQLGTTEQKVFMPTFNHINRPLDGSTAIYVPVELTSIFTQDRAYIFTEASGGAVDVTVDNFAIPNLNMQDISEISELGTQTGIAGHNGRQDFWDLYIEGSEPNNNVNDRYTSYRYFIENNTLMRELTTHYTQLTLAPESGMNEFNGVMSLSYWLNLDFEAQIGNFWIFDDISDDGWFYWNGFLEPGDATSLLMDSFILTGNVSLEYVIRINSDFFAAGHLPEDITIDARQIFMRQFEIAATIGDISTDSVPIGQQNVIVADYVELRLYSGNMFVRTIENPAWQVDIIEQDSTSHAWIGSPLRLNVGADEPNDIIHIRISEPRATNYVIIPVEIMRNEPIEPVSTYVIVPNGFPMTLDQGASGNLNAQLRRYVDGVADGYIDDANLVWTVTNAPSSSATILTGNQMTIGLDETAEYVLVQVSLVDPERTATAVGNLRVYVEELYIPFTGYRIIPQGFPMYLVPGESGALVARLRHYIDGVAQGYLDDAQFVWTLTMISTPSDPATGLVGNLATIGETETLNHLYVQVALVTGQPWEAEVVNGLRVNIDRNFTGYRIATTNFPRIVDVGDTSELTAVLRRYENGMFIEYIEDAEFVWSLMPMEPAVAPGTSVGIRFVEDYYINIEGEIVYLGTGEYQNALTLGYPEPRPNILLTVELAPDNGRVANAVNNVTVVVRQPGVQPVATYRIMPMDFPIQIWQGDTAFFQAVVRRYLDGIFDSIVEDAALVWSLMPIPGYEPTAVNTNLFGNFLQTGLNENAGQLFFMVEMNPTDSREASPVQHLRVDIGQPTYSIRLNHTVFPIMMGVDEELDLHATLIRHTQFGYDVIEDATFAWDLVLSTPFGNQISQTGQHL